MVDEEQGFLFNKTVRHHSAHSMVVATQRTLAWLEPANFETSFIVVVDEKGSYLGLDVATNGEFEQSLRRAVDVAAKRGELDGILRSATPEKGLMEVIGIKATPEDINDPAWQSYANDN